MDKAELYDAIAARKIKPKDFLPYVGDNGRVNRCAELVRSGKLKQTGALLDVGGGIGDLGYSLRAYFEERWVLDISRENVAAAAAKGNKTVVLDVDKGGLCHFPDARFDLVAALDFIEHIVDPEGFARECFRVVKPGGDVFINTPNIRFWLHMQCLAAGGHFPHTSGDREVYHGGHLAFFTYLDLVEIFSSAGFDSFELFKDEEGYSTPPRDWLKLAHPDAFKTQEEYVHVCMELGNPNLLFKASKK